MGEQIMKKIIIGSLVAFAALGFAGTAQADFGASYSTSTSASAYTDAGGVMVLYDSPNDGFAKVCESCDGGSAYVSGSTGISSVAAGAGNIAAFSETAGTAEGGADFVQSSSTSASGVQGTAEWGWNTAGSTGFSASSIPGGSSSTSGSWSFSSQHF